MIGETEFRDRVRAALYGVAIGDALGVPVENMTAKEILAATDGKGVTDYRDALQSKIKDTMKKKAGDGSDDTQLTHASVDSLVRRGKFDHVDQGRTKVLALFGTLDPAKLRHCLDVYDCSVGERIDPFASNASAWIGSGDRWGGTVEGATIEMARHIATVGKEGRDPDRAANKPQPVKGKRKQITGLGTGPAMAVPGLAIAYRGSVAIPAAPYLKDCSAELQRHVWYFAKQTHYDVRAAHAAVGIAAAIGAMLALPRSMGTDRVRETVMYRVLATVRSRESMDRRAEDYRHLYGGPDVISARVGLAFDKLGSVSRLRGAVGSGFSSLEAIPFALGIAMRNVDDFERGVLEAVNAGGDTDTIASMVGAILGARHGMAGVPGRFVHGLRKALALDTEELAPKLATLSLKIRPL